MSYKEFQARKNRPPFELRMLLPQEIKWVDWIVANTPKDPSLKDDGTVAEYGYPVFSHKAYDIGGEIFRLNPHQFYQPYQTNTGSFKKFDFWLVAVSMAQEYSLQPEDINWYSIYQIGGEKGLKYILSLPEEVY